MEKEVKRVKMIVAYDGTNYKGWQVQPNGITIEEVLNRHLSSLLGGGDHSDRREPHGFRRTFAGKRGNFRYDDAHAGG